MRRAVFGGSFDPVHRGHVAMAKAVLEAEFVDLVHVVPAWLSPFKDSSSALAIHRLAMVKLAFACESSIQVDTLEMDRSDVSYTFDSLVELKKRYPEDSLLLMVGADNLVDLHLWHQIEQIPALAALIILGRNQTSIDSNIPGKLGFLNSRVFTLPDFDYPVSSTGVRDNLSQGIFSSGDLPAAVIEYIKFHGLYV